MAETPDTYVRERATKGRKDLTYPPSPEPLAVGVYDNHSHLEIADGPERGRIRVAEPR